MLLFLKSTKCANDVKDGRAFHGRAARYRKVSRSISFRSSASAFSNVQRNRECRAPQLVAQL